MDYYKILELLRTGNKDVFDIPKEKQESFLDSFKEPSSDIERSFNQYRCQNLFVPGFKVLVLNVLSAFVLPIIYLVLFFRGLFVEREEGPFAIIENKGMPEVVPNVIREKYNPSEAYWSKTPSLSYIDLPFIFKILWHSHAHFYFVLKASMNVGLFSNMIFKYNPKVIIHYGEFSFSSSLLTDYCHIYKVKHVNIQHGEKLYNIRDGFFHFDECYVWAEHYVNLFVSLKAIPEQFIVSIPPSMKIVIDNYKNNQCFADYKYYLQEYNETELLSIIKSLSFIKDKGYSIKYRPHPRYSNLSLLKKHIASEEIEEPSNVSIMESLSNVDYVIGSYTTVLTQAYLSGKNVVLDDVTFYEQYIKLKNMNYYLSNASAILLSSLQIKNM